jgi:DNA-binding XRE family transcriptional regulator
MLKANGVQTIELAGQRFVILPEAEYLRLVGEDPASNLPAADAQGNYPAVETMRALLGADIARERQRLGWTHEELARRAGVRPGTLKLIEQGAQTPGVSTVDKIEKAFAAADG